MCSFAYLHFVTRRTYVKLQCFEKYIQNFTIRLQITHVTYLFSEEYLLRVKYEIKPIGETT